MNAETSWHYRELLRTCVTTIRAATRDQHLHNLSTRFHLAWRRALLPPTAWNQPPMLQVCEWGEPSQLKRPNFSGNWAP